MVKEMFGFDDEALQLIAGYMENVRNEVTKLRFDVKPEYLKMLMFDIENYLKFFSIQHAKKRKAKIIEAVDVKHAMKRFGEPEKLVRTHFKDPETCANAERITLTRFNTLKEKIEKTASSIILDAGCGWGRFIKKLHTYVPKNFEVVGVDIDRLSLQYGKAIDEAAMFLRSQIQALPFKDGVFDILMCSGVIHEVKDLSKRKNALREFARVIKPHGQLYIIDAFTGSKLMNILTRLLQYIPKLEVEWIFHKDQLEDILRENGFRVTSVEKVGSRVYGTITAYALTAIKSGNRFPVTKTAA
jgi:ubiquinone/menaquinone biosynthesis C-methylase UbiE